MVTPTPGGMLDQLNTALADPLLSIVARLAKSPIVGVPDQIALADLVECDFPGYSAIQLHPTLDTAIDDVGYGEMNPTRVQWIAGTIVTEQEIAAVYITKTYNGINPSLVAVVPFPVPLVVGVTGQVLEFDVNVGNVLMGGA